MILNNTGKTGGIHVETQNSDLTVNNTSDVNSILVGADKGTVQFSNSGDCIHAHVWMYEDVEATFTNNGVINLLDVSSEKGSDLKFINNGTITNTTPDPDSWDGNEWGDYAVMLGVDETGKIEFTGTGSVGKGTQCFDYYRQDQNFTPRDGASIVVKTILNDVSTDHDKNLEQVRTLAKNVTLNWEQVKKQTGANHVLAVSWGGDFPDYVYVIELTENESPAPDSEKSWTLPQLKVNANGYVELNGNGRYKNIQLWPSSTLIFRPNQNAWVRNMSVLFEDAVNPSSNQGLFLAQGTTVDVLTLELQNGHPGNVHSTFIHIDEGAVVKCLEIKGSSDLFNPAWLDVQGTLSEISIDGRTYAFSDWLAQQ